MGHRAVANLLIGWVLAATSACGSGGDSATTAAVLFKDDFSDPDTGWITGSDDISALRYDNGEFVLKLLGGPWAVWSTPGGAADVGIHVEVTARSLGVTKDAGFGVLCHYQDDNNYYSLGIDTQGFFAIAKYVDGQLYILSDPSGSWVPSPDLQPDRPAYRVGADCANGSLTLYAEGITIASTNDSTFASGGYGVFAFTFQANGDADVHFDDFVVTALP